MMAAGRCRQVRRAGTQADRRRSADAAPPGRGTRFFPGCRPDQPPEGGQGPGRPARPRGLPEAAGRAGSRSGEREEVTAATERLVRLDDTWGKKAEAAATWR